MWESGPGQRTPYILVNGSYIYPEVGSVFSSTVMNAAVEARFGKFRVYSDGVEVLPEQCPALFEENTKIEIRPYDVAGE